MKILMIGPDPKVRGGISTVINGYLASDLVRRHDIRFLPSYIDYTGRFAALRKLMKGITSYFLFLVDVAGRKPDLVHIHSSFGASFYRKSAFFIMCRVLGLRTVNHIHGAEFSNFYTYAGSLKKRFVSWVYRLPDATLVLSESWKRDISEILGENAQIYVLRNSVKKPAYIKPYSERGEKILFLGEIGKRKGAFDLPGIIQKVSAVHSSAEFIICGNGEIEAVTEILRGMGLSDKAVFPGWIMNDKKTEFLNDSSIFLLPSYNEGLPMSILEAMNYGLPIVTTNVGGIPELLENGRNGFMSEPGDIEAASGSIIKLLEDKKLASAISLCNSEKIGKEYSIELIIEQLDAIYRRLQ